MSTDKKKYYIDNKRFEEVILGYKQDKPKYEGELVEMFRLLFTNIYMSFKFKVDFDDAHQDCFILFLKVLANFDKAEGTAFNYFTTVIMNNLRLIYTKNKKYQQKMLEYRKAKGEIDIELDFESEA